MSSKFFANIRTTVELVDTQVLDAISLKVTFPENTLIKDRLSKLDPNFKFRMTSQDNIYFVAEIPMSESKAIITSLLNDFAELDKKYSDRATKVNDILSLLD